MTADKKDLSDVVEEAVKRAPKKDVGLFLKMVGIAIFIIAVGIAISFIKFGKVSFFSSETALEPEAAPVVEQKIAIGTAGDAGSTVTISKTFVIPSHKDD